MIFFVFFFKPIGNFGSSACTMQILVMGPKNWETFNIFDILVIPIPQKKKIVFYLSAPNRRSSFKDFLYTKTFPALHGGKNEGDISFCKGGVVSIVLSSDENKHFQTRDVYRKTYRETTSSGVCIYSIKPSGNIAIVLRSNIWYL